VTPEQLIAKWEADAAELLRTSKAYRSTCNAALKSGYVGRASALLACAAALRESLDTYAD
jgi:hypothetical protein